LGFVNTPIYGLRVSIKCDLFLLSADKKHTNIEKNVYCILILFNICFYWFYCIFIHFFTVFNDIWHIHLSSFWRYFFGYMTEHLPYSEHQWMKTIFLWLDIFQFYVCLIVSSFFCFIFLFFLFLKKLCWYIYWWWFFMSCLDNLCKVPTCLYKLIW